MFMTVYNVVGMGTAILVSQLLGAGERDKADHVSNIALAVNTLFGVLSSLILCAFSGSILHIMNIPKELLKEASQYTIIVGGALFCQAMFSTMSAVIRSHGFTKYPMFVAFGMNLMNILGNSIVVFKPFGMPAFGVPGIAFTVVICNLLGVAAMLLILIKIIKLDYGRKYFFPFPKNLLVDILKVGAPAAGEYISYTFSQLMITSIATSMGSTAVMTRVYIQNITTFMSVFSLSIGQGTQILIGHMIGAGDTKKARGICLKSLRTAFFVNVLMTSVLVIFRKPVLEVFTHDPSIIQLGCMILILDLAWEAGRPLNHVVGYSLRGTGDVRYPTVIAVICHVGNWRNALLAFRDIHAYRPGWNLDCLGS